MRLPPSEDGPEKGDGVPYCVHCGNQVAEQAATCPHCGQQQPMAAAAPPGGYAPARRTEGLAVASLITGIFAWVACPIVLHVVAIVLGNRAQERIAADPTLEGDGLAKAGVVLGWVGVALYGLMFAVFMVFMVAALLSA